MHSRMRTHFPAPVGNVPRWPGGLAARQVSNEGWEYEPVDVSGHGVEEERIRGYRLKKVGNPIQATHACTRATRAQMETGTDTSTDAKDVRFYTCGRACTHFGASAHRSSHLLSHVDLRIHRRCCLRGRRIRLMQLTAALQV